MGEFQAIGKVESTFTEPADPFEMRKHESTLRVKAEFADGLYRIEESSHLQVLFHFHRGRDELSLIGRRYHGEKKGVFASRSPNRPAPIGVTTVELLERSGTVLRVRGLDAIDGTPVLDIKPYVPQFDEAAQKDSSRSFAARYPRGAILPLVKRKDAESLLLKAGSFHGHYCPGLSLGVMAAVHGLHQLADRASTDCTALFQDAGMEQLLAIVEVNSCFADGIQYVAGCTFGNNGLIFKDAGKTAVTFTLRGGTAVRLRVKDDYRELLAKKVPDFYPLFEKVVQNSSRDPQLLREFTSVGRRAGFVLTKVKPETLFCMQEVSADIPEYAPPRGSVVCSKCGEPVMAGKTVDDTLGAGPSCAICAGGPVSTLTGDGITETYTKE